MHTASLYSFGGGWFAVCMRTLWLSFILVFGACAHRPEIASPQKFTSSLCRQRFTDAVLQEPLGQLNSLSDLYSQRCLHEVITLGSYIRSHHRDKFYSVLSEIGELATPEGSLTEYVLESYERSYLSLLLSLSYLGLGMEESALVELRHSVMDEGARIYNYGDDPVITLLQAVLWSNLDPVVSRPYWKRLSEKTVADASIRQFAKERVAELDQGESDIAEWKIYGLGYLPPLTWKTDFLKREKGPYKIRAAGAFPKACSTSQALLIPTASWSDKLSRRYEAGYHPLVYSKSLARVPFGLVYGAAGVTAGVATGVAGCGAASYIRSEDLCRASLRGAVYVIEKTGDLVAYTLAPDLRRWERIPAAFYVTREEGRHTFGECYRKSEVAAMPLQILKE